MKVNSSGSRCNAKNINGELLENKLIEYLKAYNKDTLIKSLTDVLNETKKIENDMGISNIDNDINMTNDSIKKLLSKLALIDDEDVSKIILTEIKSLKDKIKDLEKKKSTTLDKQSDIVLTQTEIMSIINKLDNFNNLYDDLDFDAKKITLNNLLESIVYDDEKLHLKFNVKKN